MTRSVSDTVFAVCGEALVDAIEDRSGTVVLHPGGSPTNVAVGLSRLGHPTSLLTQLGGDSNGQLLLRYLHDNTVALAPGSVLDNRRTSVARCRLGKDGDAEYTFDFTWGQFDASATQAADRRADCVHVGSIGAVYGAGSATVTDLIEASRSAATISYDPNCRPALMGDPRICRARVEAIVSASDIVKVSHTDLAWLYPGRDHAAVASSWLDRGCSLVVLTLGSEGAWAATPNCSVSVDPQPIKVMDTVGAGDAFTSGLLAACGSAGLLGAGHRRELAGITAVDVVDLLRFAARIAAITCARRGADPPWSTDLW